jgi:hypothetical protein
MNIPEFGLQKPPRLNLSRANHFDKPECVHLHRDVVEEHISWLFTGPWYRTGPGADRAPLRGASAESERGGGNWSVGPFGWEATLSLDEVEQLLPDRGWQIRSSIEYEFPAVIIPVIFQNVRAEVIGEKFEVIVVLAIPPIEQFLDLEFPLAEIEPHWPLVDLVSTVAFDS